MVKTNKKTNEWQNFLQLCTKLKTKQQFAYLFELFLTKAEEEDIALRYTVLTKLLSGMETQRNIAKELKISIAKITRGSNALKIADKKLLAMLRCL